MLFKMNVKHPDDYEIILGAIAPTLADVEAQARHAASLAQPDFPCLGIDVMDEDETVVLARLMAEGEWVPCGS